MRISWSLVSVTLVFAAASCGPKKDANKDYALEAGAYSFTIESVATDTCWPTEDSWPPILTTEITIDPSAVGFTFSVPPIVQWLVPVLEAPAPADNLLSANGETVVTYGDQCSVKVSDEISGAMLADNVFEGAMEVTFDAGINNTLGQMSDCTALAGTTVALLVPFPTLSNPQNGLCSTTLHIRIEP